MEIIKGKSYEVIGDRTHHLFKNGSIIQAIEEPDGRPNRFLAIGWVDTFTRNMERWVDVRDVQEMVSEEEVQQAIASIKSAIR